MTTKQEPLRTDGGATAGFIDGDELAVSLGLTLRDRRKKQWLTLQQLADLLTDAELTEKFFADPGATVEDRAPLVLLDAMKMDTYIYAPRKGVIANQCVAVGEPVQAGDVLVRYQPSENQV